jgi:hypothetical protein
VSGAADPLPLYACMECNGEIVYGRDEQQQDPKLALQYKWQTVTNLFTNMI